MEDKEGIREKAGLDKEGIRKKTGRKVRQMHKKFSIEKLTPKFFWLMMARKAQSNPRKQKVIPATDFEYSKICVILRKVASSEDKMKINSELLLSCKLIKCLQNNVRK